MCYKGPIFVAYRCWLCYPSNIHIHTSFFLQTVSRSEEKLRCENKQNQKTHKDCVDPKKTCSKFKFCESVLL